MPLKTVTFSVLASADDGRQTRSGSSYPPTGTVNSSTTTTTTTPRKRLSGSTHTVDVAEFRFNTASLPDDAKVERASLILYVDGSGSQNDDGRNFVGEWYVNSNWPIDSTDYTSSVGEDAFSISLSNAPTASTTWTISLLNPDLNINRSGYTGFRVGVNGGAATGENFVQFALQDHASDPAPILSITYFTMAIDSLTVGELIHELSGPAFLNDRVTSGTASSGSASTLLDVTTGTSGLARYNTNDHRLLLGKNLIIYKGTRAGDFVAISAFNATTVTITPDPNFGGAIDSTSQYMITNRWTLTDYLAAFRQAARELRRIRPPFVTEAVGRETVLGTDILNASFDLYTTANVPDSWNLDGNSTFTQETSLSRAGRRSLKIVTDGTNVGSIRQTLPDIGRYFGRSVRVIGAAFCTTASRLTLELADGISAATTATHGGTGWEWLDTGLRSINANASKIQPSFEISAGSAVVAYLSYIYLPQPEHQHRYTLDADISLYALEPNLYVSEPIGENKDGGATFKTLIPGGAWDILYESPRKLALDIDDSYNGRILEYRGWKYFTTPTAVTTTWDGDPDPVLKVAAAILLEGANDPRAKEFRALAEDAKRRGKILHGVKVVEPN